MTGGSSPTMLSFCRELLLLHSSCAEVRLNPTIESHSESIMKTFPYSNATIIIVCGGHDTRFNIALRFNGEYLLQCMKTFKQ